MLSRNFFFARGKFGPRLQGFVCRLAAYRAGFAFSLAFYSSKRVYVGARRRNSRRGR
jgi:hypothetical protein